MSGTDRTKQQARTPEAGGLCVWVLASGPFTGYPTKASWLPPPDKVIAADGGSTLAAKLGVTPDIIVGDFDSSDPEVVSRFERLGTEFRRYQHHLKLETDTELALYTALEFVPVRIILLGALGGRLDHALANLLMLSNDKLVGVDLRIVDGLEEAYLVRPGIHRMVEGEIGDTVSLIPLTDRVEGITIKGFEYPLRGEILLRGTGRGVSNRLANEIAEIWFEEGLLFLVHAHGGESS